RLIVSHEMEAHQPCPDESISQRQRQGEHGTLARRVALRMGEKSPDDEPQDEGQEQPDGGTVAQLNELLQGTVVRNQLTIAIRPVVAAAIAGDTGADERAPEDDGQVIGRQPPGILMEPQSRHESMSSPPPAPRPGT